MHLARRTLLCLAACSLAGSMAFAAPLQAKVENHTQPTTCAEEDNVSLTLSAPGLRRFRVEAVPPPYLATIRQDSTAPDFSGCNFDGSSHPTDPRHTFEPRREVLHDGERWMIVGLTLPSFWRPHQVPVRVDTHQTGGLHLIQVFAKTPGKPLEVLVLYPADGYWRIKPVPPARFGDGVYGSSFVMGPVEQDGRPVANIASIEIDTQPLAFRLRFADGSRARVGVAEVSEARTTLDVTLEPGKRRGKRSPRFAVLRSMYVTPDNADMSEVQWRTAPGEETTTRTLPEVTALHASQVRFGRTTPSRHNTSAPDIVFEGFEAARRSR